MSARHNHALRSTRSLNRRKPAPFDPRTILADLHGEQMAKVVSQREINRAHGQALIENSEFDERQYQMTYALWGGFEPHAGWEWALAVGADMAHPDFDEMYQAYVEEWESNHESQYDDGYQPGDWRYQDDEVEVPNMYTHDDCWMPYSTVEQARETFSGTDFLVVRSGW